MATRRIIGVNVEVDDEGFFMHPGEWTQRMAPILAKEAGIAGLTPEHWKVIDFLRHEYLEKGAPPTARTFGEARELRTTDLERLFPRGRLKVAAKIAGIPRPRACA